MRIKPKKSLGQNFLTDNNIRKKIIVAACISPTDVVLEIGSGRGEMTLGLAERARKVYALELDDRLIPQLEGILSGHKNIVLIHKDILKFNIGKQIKERRVKVFGNIPYYISSPIIERLVEHRNKISSAYLTTQKEFAERIVAVPGTKEYGSFSCFVQYYFEPQIKFIISRNCFDPVPSVDSALVEFKARANPPVKVKDEERFFKVIRAAFNKRRKTLRNSLEGVVPKDALSLSLNETGLDENVRPERLSLEDFARISNI